MLLGAHTGIMKFCLLCVDAHTGNKHTAHRVVYFDHPCVRCGAGRRITYKMYMESCCVCAREISNAARAAARS